MADQAEGPKSKREEPVKTEADEPRASLQESKSGHVRHHSVRVEISEGAVAPETTEPAAASDPWCSRGLWCPRKQKFDGREKLTVFSPAEVSEHRFENDCWIVHRELVFDVTAYLDSHPGGRDKILEYAGADCTDIFALTGHSAQAHADLYRYVIGSLDTKGEGSLCQPSQMASLNASLTSRSLLSPNIIRVEVTTVSGDAMELRPGEHVFLQVKDPSGQVVSRPYTPIDVSPSADGGATVFTFVVKVYPPAPPVFPQGGRMSTLLANVEIGAAVTVVGPDSDCVYQGKGSLRMSDGSVVHDVPRLHMIAGGTGITPLYSFLRAIDAESHKADSSTNVKWDLIFANRAVDDIILRDELLQLAAAGNGTVYNTVSALTDEQKGTWTGGQGRVTADMIRQTFTMEPDSKALFLLCGPPAMMMAMHDILTRQLAVPAGRIVWLGASPPQDPTRKAKSASLWQRLVDWHCRNPHLLYFVTALLLVLTLLAISRGQYGLGHRFKIRGFSKGGYAYILDDEDNWDFWQTYGHWIAYVPHQLAVIALVGCAQYQSPSYSSRFRWFNWALFGVNAGFIALKWTQTHLTYNGLSSQLPLWFGVATVALMLMLVQSMYIGTRGVVCGCGRGQPACCSTKEGGAPVRCSFWHQAGLYIRKYHAYYIAFALVNDFWYHPFESTPGHMLGVLNDILLLWQTTAIYTHGHRNKFWCLVLECMVLPHSGLIALDRGTGASGMFGFAYFFLLVATQQFQISMHWSLRVLLMLVFLVSVGLTFGFSAQYDCTNCRSVDIGSFYMIFFIPALNYALAVIYFPGMYWLFRLCISRVPSRKAKIGLSVVASTIVMAAMFPVFSIFINSSAVNATERLLDMQSSLNVSQCQVQRCAGYANFTREVDGSTNGFEVFNFNFTQP